MREKVIIQRIPSDDSSSPHDPDTVSVDYIKAAQFRTIHPDGAISALTARGRIELAFFCERKAIPNRVVHKLNDDGSLGPIIEVKSRGSVIRDIDLVVALQPEVALSVAQFIMSQFDEHIQKQAKKKHPSKKSKKGVSR